AGAAAAPPDRTASASPGSTRPCRRTARPAGATAAPVRLSPARPPAAARPARRRRRFGFRRPGRLRRHRDAPLAHVVQLNHAMFACYPGRPVPVYESREPVKPSLHPPRPTLAPLDITTLAG